MLIRIVSHNFTQYKYEYVWNDTWGSDAYIRFENSSHR